MITKNGSLFDSNAPYIGHGVNTYGVMGAGIAVPYREYFGEDMFMSYRKACDSTGTGEGEGRTDGKGSLQPGGLHWWQGEDGAQRAFNIASQSLPGRYATESWLTMGLFRAANHAHLNYIHNRVEPRIAIPAMGCGIGGLHLDSLKRSILAVEDYFPKTQFELWLF